MNKKRIFACAAAVCLLFCACSYPLGEDADIGTASSSFNTESITPAPSQAESEPLTLTKDEELALGETAAVLTEALASCTQGFSTTAEPASNNLSFPCESIDSEHRQNAFNQFIYLLAAKQGNGYQGSIYSNLIYKDESGLYHISAKGITEILNDVLGVTSWQASTSNLNYNSSADEYTTGLEFGTGWGNWRCGEVKESRIDPESRLITVVFRADYLFPGASGELEECYSWLCESTFEINRKADGRLYLTFINTEAVKPEYPEID